MFLSFKDGEISFKDKNIHKILETDREINDGVYKEFFTLQEQGKVIKIKNINGVNFKDIFEVSEPEKREPRPTLEERLEALEIMELERLLGGM